jgi:hypothetical protein
LAFKSLWVVNTEDWVDVEYTLRKLLRCESTDCHTFYSIGYVYFRSSVVSHVARPGQYLEAGMLYRFPETEVVWRFCRQRRRGWWRWRVIWSMCSEEV